MCAPHWKRAMMEEMSALEKNETWEIVDLPPGKKTVGSKCKWVYTVKFQPSGEIERYKARLVARGFTQTKGIDYGETLSTEAKVISIRILLSLATQRSWPLYQLDVKNAFLHGDSHEEVYIEIAPGYGRKGESHKVCRLKKALYGLKQSPRAWFEKFSKAIVSFGYKRCASDHTHFVIKVEKVSRIIVNV